jgi:UDP-3-O-[3-hydroxymyristoyl] glucosamine N-acyltransferase
MEFTANQIASFVGGTVEGDGEVKVGTFAKIEEGMPGELTFLANPKYTHYVYDTKASIVLVSNDFAAEHPISATLIRVANPYETLAELMRMVAAATTNLPTGVEQPSFVAEGVDVPADAYVGAFAYVGKNVKLGVGVKIFPQVYVGDNATIGDNTILYPGCKIYHGCKIGKNCIIHAGVVIGADGFGFAPDSEGHYHKIPQLGIVEIEDDVEVGANTTIDRSTLNATRVGKGTKLDNLIQLAHNVEIGNDTVIASQTGVAGSTKIGSNCAIGGQVGFAGHLHIGDRVQIGAQSGVPKNVPSNKTIMGYPATDLGDFYRSVAYIRRLPKLFDDVNNLIKLNNKK